jgi:hypothetical protein
MDDPKVKEVEGDSFSDVVYKTINNPVKRYEWVVKGKVRKLLYHRFGIVGGLSSKDIIYQSISDRNILLQKLRNRKEKIDEL